MAARSIRRIAGRRTSMCDSDRVLPPARLALLTVLAWLGFAPLATAADLAVTQKQFLTGQYQECLESATAALKDNDWQESFWTLKIRSELTLGRYADAAATFEAALKRHPNSVQMRWYGLEVCRTSGQAERVPKLEAEMVELIKLSPWRYSDSGNQVIIGRWMLSQRTDAKKVLTGIYQEAKRRMPGNIDVPLAIGDLALEKHDYKLAGDSFQAAAKLDAEHPEAHFGIAQAFAPSNSERAEAALKAALTINPRHIPSLLMVVDSHVDAERYDEAGKILAEIEAVNAQHPLALAYRAILAHLQNQPEKEKAHRAAALNSWSQNPAVDHLIGRKLSQKYRFAEGSAYQRQALQLDPQYQLAKIQLAQDLLRLGKEEEGLKLAEEVYGADGYNIFAHNLVTLQESLVKFRTLEADGFLVRMDAREAEIYGQRVLSLLKRAKAELCRKYDVKLDPPIIVELFPRQQDFAIRTFGLPGGAGFLGVCFGTVITANSPASQSARPACWEATLWHEFCHVVTLSKTNNKMPRWLSEGISVYEERLADPSWGQTINPQYRQMILGEDFTPVSQLSAAFLKPKSGLHLQFAYYESSLVVEYLIEKYGLKTLQRVLVDLGVGMPINESLGRYTGSIEALDKEFAAFAKQRAEAMAPKADWTEPELPKRATVDAVTAWLKEHPNNYSALGKLARLQLTAKQWAEAKTTLETMRDLYPEDGNAGSPYALLARVYRELNDSAAERKSLEKLATLSCNDPDALLRLCELTSSAGDWPATMKNVLRVLAINPLTPAIHRRAAAAAAQLKDQALLVDSYRALLLLENFDMAEAHYQFAAALRDQGELGEAKRHVLLALEEAPRYRAAQKLLLDLVADKPATKPVETAEPVKPAAEKPAEQPTTSEEKKP